MTSDEWRQIKTIVQSALETEPEKRVSFVAVNCASDKFLLREVESLLASYNKAGDFIETPAFVGKIRTSDINTFSSELESGRRIGHYEILSELGRGGMGAVYLAEDVQLKRKAAIKMLPADFAAQAPRVSRFQQEARTVSTLNHPNILTIYEVGYVESTHFIATEFIDGVTLRQYMVDAPLNLTVALDVSVQVGTALAAAHFAGIVHRDIKPENIMIRRDGLVKVLDFGIAKLIAQTAAAAVDGEQEIKKLNETQQYFLLGTPKYISPEQVRGHPVDARTDVWSLGMVLYEMVAGRSPYEGKTGGEIITLMLDGKPPPPPPPLTPSEAAESSTELNRIVSKCLEPDREERYQSVQEFLSDISKLKREIDPGATVETKKAERNLPATGLSLALVALATAAIITLLVYIPAFRGLPVTPAPEVKSLAVLPLENAGDNSIPDYLADGLTEALTNELAQVGSLRVISHTSAMRYNSQQRSLLQIARELNVDTVVEGKILRSGEQIRIAVTLTYIPTGLQLWSDSFEGDLRDILALQQEVARDITGKISIKLTPQEQARLSNARSVNPEALDAYLKGRYHLNKRNEKEIKTAIAYFEEAIDKDSGFALSYAFLADAYFALGTVIVSALPPTEALAKGEAAALKAVELDETLAEARTALAVIKLYKWEWLAAEQEFKKALELNPNYAPTHSWYAIYFAARGRVGESIARMYRAREIDPLSLHIGQNVGWMLHYARQYDEEIEQYRQTLEQDPNFLFARRRLAGAYLAKGMFDEAIAEFERVIASSDRNPATLGALAQAYGRAGRKEKAREILRELLEMRKREYVNPYSIAMVYVGLGERDPAFKWLEKAYDERSYAMVFLKVTRDLEPFQNDPRMTNILRRIGLS